MTEITRKTLNKSFNKQTQNTLVIILVNSYAYK